MQARIKVSLGCMANTVLGLSLNAIVQERTDIVAGGQSIALQHGRDHGRIAFGRLDAGKGGGIVAFHDCRRRRRGGGRRKGSHGDLVVEQYKGKVESMNE